jgi:polysaccharide export outer membrane protein
MTAIPHMSPTLPQRFARAIIALCCVAAVSGCELAGSGFLRNDLDSADEVPALDGIQLVQIDADVTQHLLAQRSTRMFSEAFGEMPVDAQRVGPGDVLSVTIWEAPPPALFSVGPTDPSLAPSTARAAALPDQAVNAAGSITVPFAGAVQADGKSVTEIEAEIADRLKGKANRPQVIVRRLANVSSQVTVFGDVAKSTLVPLSPRGERVLDALAAAGGVRQPVNKMTIQVTRGGAVHALPLETIIRDPRQNVPLRPGDVVTALFQPLSFTALGASGKNEEVSFEAQGITLAQALARIGGLNDARADARGVFLFRFEPKDALPWPRKPVRVTPEEKVPVIYRADLKDPRTFFVAQSFPIHDRDVIYVSNASAAELQKFLNLLFSIIYPLDITNRSLN